MLGCDAAGASGSADTAAGSSDTAAALPDGTAAPDTKDIAPGPTVCPAPTATGTAVGSVAADFSLLDCAGAKRTLYARCGTPVILVAFTYAWCPTCIEVTPELDKIAEEHGDDVAVIQILFESATGNPATSATCNGFVKKYEIARHQVLVDPLKGMDIYYDHVVDESPGRVLVIDGRTMTLLHNSAEYESDHAILRGWVADAVAAAGGG